MRYAIIADVHSNLVAFQAVLQDIESKGGIDEIWCLGDVVGYGPEPHACIELLCQYKHICVAGNHDWAAISKLDISDFNPYAAQAILWTRQQLAAGDMNYLQDLPQKIKRGDFTLVHGSPRHPIWEYLEPGWLSTKDSLKHYSVTKIPSAIRLSFESERLIINPGGVGQPRDGDPRASYAIYDGEAQMVYYYRVNYDISATQQKMMEYNLPSPLTERLSYGY